jgi:hypothetical protein
MVDRGGRDAKREFLYYGTDFLASFRPARAAVENKRAFVRYITHSGGHLR